MPPAAQPAYSKDERVLCFHHDQLYEAKVLETKLSDFDDKKSQSMLYRVHYKGWKNTWDDWVIGERLRKYTEENIELARSLKKDLDAQRKPPPPKAITSKKRMGGSDLSSTRGSEERHSSVPATGRGQKRGRDNEIDKVGSKISFPDSLFPPRIPKPGEISPALRGFVAITGPRSTHSTEDPNNMLHFQGYSDSQTTFQERLEYVVSTGFDQAELAKDIHTLKTSGATELQSSVTELLSKAPPRDGKSRYLIESTWHSLPALPTTGEPPRPEKVVHPQFKKLIYWDAGNEAKRHFFKAQKPGLKLMIAGVPPVQKDDSEDDSSSEDASNPEDADALMGANEYQDFDLDNDETTLDAASCQDPGAPVGDAMDNPICPTKDLVSASRISLESVGNSFSTRFVTRKRIIKARVPRNRVNSPHLQEDTFYAKPAIRIPCPDNLKSILVDDWENVTKNLLLVHLPSKTPVNMILEAYFEEEKQKRRLGSAEADILEEVVCGVKSYFTSALGRILLYRFEREQFYEIRKLWEGAVGNEWEGKGPGDVYGAEHLARLFVKMPELIAQTNMDHQSINRLKEEMTKMTGWLSKNVSKYFVADYAAVSQEYIEKARAS